MPRKKQSRWRAAALLLALACLTTVGVLGWKWLDALVCTRIVVDGNRYAPHAEVLAVARVDTGIRLLDVEPEIIADRVARHPWVRRADVRRLPPGTVSIRVVERSPVALALSGEGRPAAFVDAEGFTMPLADDAVHDVPLIHGLKLPPNRTQRLEQPAVLELLGALGKLDDRMNVLVSSFTISPDGDITLHTVPAAGRGAVPVRIGRRGFAEKFERLAAFWEQAVLSRPEKTFDMIDLRFDSQIVTHES